MDFVTGPPDTISLLPAGLSDLLPLEAAHEADIVYALMNHLDSFGYERVKPPLAEFEETLLSGIGEKCAPYCLRVMDPASQRMMAIRSDITVQAARMATTCLAEAPRPLRLSYCGEVLRGHADALRSERQFCQIGAELIGSDSIAADAEVVTLAVSALKKVGIPHLTVDLQMPTLADALVAEFSLDEAQARQLYHALDRKDMTAISDMPAPCRALVPALIDCVGPVDDALPLLEALELPEPAAREARRLSEAALTLRAELPDQAVSIDPTDQHALDYHTGLTFSIYARGAHGELGQGGRYLASNKAGYESATGFTLFLDMLTPIVPTKPAAQRVYVPLRTPQRDQEHLAQQGYVIIRQLDPIADVTAEAQRLNCGLVCKNGKVLPVKTGPAKTGTTTKKATPTKAPAKKT